MVPSWPPSQHPGLLQSFSIGRHLHQFFSAGPLTGSRFSVFSALPEGFRVQCQRTLLEEGRRPSIALLLFSVYTLIEILSSHIKYLDWQVYLLGQRQMDTQLMTLKVEGMIMSSN